MTAAVRFLSVLADLRFLLPGIAVLLLGAFAPAWAATALIVLAQPLLAAGATRVLDYEIDAGWFDLLLRRGPLLLLWWLAYAVLVLLAVGWPLLALLGARTPLLALALSLGLLAVIGAALRLWPAPGLAMLWDDAYEDASLASALERSAAFAMHLTGQQGDRHFGAGVLVALALVTNILAAAALCGYVAFAPLQPWQLQAWVAYAALLAPGAHLLLQWRTAALLIVPDEAAPEPARTLDAPAGTGKAPAAAWDETPTEPLDRNLALLNAAAAGQLEQALALLAAGADANAAPGPNDRDQRSALCIAATQSDLSLLRALIGKGANPNLAVNGVTALHAATRDTLHGRPDAVMTLLANGARPDSVDHDGNTPLHHAAMGEDPTILAMLLDAGAAPDLVNREGLTALAIAARAGHEAVVRLLLERHARIEPARGLSALIAAASGHADRPAIVKRLLKAKAEIGAVDKLGRQALHAAALHGHGDCADALIAAGADVNARDSHGVTPLMEAARAGANRVLARLLFRKPDPSPVDGQGRNALHLACASRQANLETVKALLALGIDTQATTRDGRRAVDIASASGRWDLVAAIDPSAARPATLDAVDDEREQPPAHAERERLLLESLRAGHAHIAEELLALEPPLPTEVLLRAFRVVLERDDLAALRALRAHGFEPFAPPLDDNEALQLAVRLQPVPTRCLGELIASGAAVAGAGVLLPLLTNAADADVGARAAIDALALTMIERGADAHARISSGDSALNLALRAELPATALALVARGVDVNAADRSGQTALHLLMRASPELRRSVLPALLRAGADPERAAADGETPLGRATLLRREDALRLMRWPRWRLPRRALLAADLPAAAQAGDRDAVQKLLELGLPIDSRDVQGCTALLRAAGGGFEDIVDDLLAAGADPAISAHGGGSALSAAVHRGFDRVVAKLAAAGAAVDQPLPGGVTPLMLAAALGNERMLQTLLVRGASALAQDEAGNTALHAAVQFAWNAEDAQAALRVIDRLLDGGAPIDACNLDAQTPLLLLLGARVEAGVRSPNRELTLLIERLINRGADIDVQDRRGISVLHAAAMHGMRDVAERLLKAGADPRRRDGLARSAHEVAVLLGYVDLATLLKRD
jgi:hypothetical protein